MEQRKTVIVTGSSGLIGYPTCERLAKTFNVLAFDRPGLPSPPPSAATVDVDLTSEESVRRAFQLVRRRYGNDIASVIHLAAFYDFSGQPSPKYQEITVKGTERLLRFLQTFNVEQFVFSSTMLVHAPTRPGEPINEDSPIQPKWPYPESKVKTEELIRQKCGKIPVVLVRIAGVYDDEGHSIPLSQQIQRIREKQLISHFFSGNLSHGQSFLHLKDLVDLLERMVELRSKLPPELVFLAGEPETLSYGYLQKEMGKLIHGRPWKTFRVPKPLAKLGALVLDRISRGQAFIKPWMIDQADDHYELNIDRARAHLGWKPAHSLSDTLPRMIAPKKKTTQEKPKKELVGKS